MERFLCFPRAANVACPRIGSGACEENERAAAQFRAVFAAVMSGRLADNDMRHSL
jgi:hypothetical protein